MPEVDDELQPVLLDFHGVGRRLAAEHLEAGLLALAPHPVNERGHSPRLQSRSQHVDEVAHARRRAVAIRSEDRHGTVTVYNEARKAVSLAMKHAVGGRRATPEEALAERACPPDSVPEQSLVDGRLAARPEAHRDGGPGIGQPPAHRRPVRGEHLHFLACRRLFQAPCDGLPPDPGVTVGEPVGSVAGPEGDLEDSAHVR